MYIFKAALSQCFTGEAPHNFRAALFVCFWPVRSHLLIPHESQTLISAHAWSEPLSGRWWKNNHQTPGEKSKHAYYSNVCSPGEKKRVWELRTLELFPKGPFAVCWTKRHTKESLWRVFSPALAFSLWKSDPLRRKCIIKLVWNVAPIIIYFLRVAARRCAMGRNLIKCTN